MHSNVLKSLRLPKSVFVIYIVCSSSKRSTIVSRHLVRRFTWFSSEKYGRTNDRSWETWCNVRDVWFDVHAKSRFKNGPADEKTVYKIRLPFFFLRIFFEYVKI